MKHPADFEHARRSHGLIPGLAMDYMDPLPGAGAPLPLCLGYGVGPGWPWAPLRELSSIIAEQVALDAEPA